jgi:hypothetical protein
MGLLFLMKNYAEKHLKAEAAKEEEEEEKSDSEDSDVLTSEQSQKKLQELKLQGIP